VPGVQPSLVDVGGGGRVSQGEDRSQAGDEGVLDEAVPSDRRPRDGRPRSAVQERPQEVQHGPHHRRPCTRHHRQLRKRLHPRRQGIPVGKPATVCVFPPAYGILSETWSPLSGYIW